MLQDIYEQYLFEAMGKNLELNIEKGQHRKATFDRKWTTEALGNIVDNAIKYTNTGEINIKVHEYEIFHKILTYQIQELGCIHPSKQKYFHVFIVLNQYTTMKVREMGFLLTREIISSEGGYIN